MDTVDFKKTLKHLYRPSSKEFSIVDVPEMKFLMIDVVCDPGISPVNAGDRDSWKSTMAPPSHPPRTERGQRAQKATLQSSIEQTSASLDFGSLPS